MTPNETIAGLRENGYTVKVSHRRILAGTKYTTTISKKGAHAVGVTVEPRGGRTAVTIWKGDGLVARGEALCSQRDNFCRRRGLEIALGRALKDQRGTSLDQIYKEMVNC